MAVPKRKTSKSRTKKRRTKLKSQEPQITSCPTTGEPHLYHRAYWHDNKLYYKGKVVMER